jgi:hypothetical protein
VNDLTTTGVLGVERMPHAFGHARRWLVIGASAAIVLLAGFGLWGFAISDDGAAATATPPIGGAAAHPTITVEPIPVTPHPASREAAEIEMGPDPLPAKQAAPKEAAAALAQPSHQGPRDTPRRSVHKDLKAVALAPFTHEQLTQKYKQVRREYDGYRSKFGARLEREWSDLATFIQFMPSSSDDAGRREAARRLDAFRGRMRE